MNSSFKDGVQFAWDATSLTSAMTCPRKYYYSNVLGIQPKGRSAHLVFGGHYASALEHFHKFRATGMDTHEATIATVRKAMIDSWAEPIPEGVPAKNRFSLIRSIVWYIEHFGSPDDNAPQTYHLVDGKPAVELSFSFELSSTTILCGHLDQVVEFQGDKFVMDQKTTGSALSTYYFTQFDLDNQMSCYSLAGSVILDTPVKGVIIDAAQIGVNFTRFARGFTFRNKAQLAEWTQNVNDVIMRMHQYHDQDFYPMNLSACGNYGGCPFAQICKTSPRLRPNIIKGDYVEKIWDPLERR